MHIVLDARYLDGTYSGIGTYSRLLVQHLAAVDDENKYTVLVRPGFRSSAVLPGNFEFLSWAPAPISAATLFQLHRQLERLKPDLLHSLFPLAPMLGDIPTMVTVHDLQPFLDPNFSGRRPLGLQHLYHWFYKWSYPGTIRRARWVVCDSHSTRDDVAAYMPESVAKLIVVHPGLDTSQFDRPSPERVQETLGRLGITDDYFLYYGSTRPNKNLPVLLRAFARLVGESPSPATGLKLVLVLKKDRFFADVRRTMQRKRLDRSVVVLDQLEPEDQKALLAGARAFTFATKYEGFGFPALEAMAAGVPVIAGDSGSLPEICSDAALIVDPDDAAEIADAMRRLLVDPLLRDSLIARGLERARHFRWEDTATRMRDIYKLLF